MKHKVKPIAPYVEQFYKGNHIAFLGAMLATILISLVNLLLAWLMQQMIDALSNPAAGYTPLELMWIIVGVLAIIIIVKWISFLAKPRFIQKAMIQYKSFSFDKLMRKNIATFSRENTSVYLSAFSNDATAIEKGYLDQMFDVLFNIILMSGSLIMMLFYSPLLTVVAVVLALLPMVAAFFTGKCMNKMERSVSDQNEHFISSLKDTLTGFSVVKSFGAEKAMAALFQKTNEGLETEKCHKQRLSTFLSILGSVASITTQFGTLLVGLLLVNTGYELTPGVLIIFADLVANVIRPINDLPDQLAQRRAALELIDKLAAELENNIRDEGVDIESKLTQGISFHDVSFGYNKNKDILKNINIKFEAGKSYAIVGGSGSGKSTLLNMMMGAQDDYSGKIYYDNYELRNISSEALYNMVNIIQQKVFVFNDSILNNITLYQQFTETEVKSAIEHSGLSGMISERGGELHCGENGGNLSGGEKQRISIARSLLRKAPVLLADEATAALDSETAYQVTDSILKLQGLTRIIVTHRLDAALLKQYDNILVMKNGRIVEQGKFEELIARKDAFFALYNTAQ